MAKLRDKLYNRIIEGTLTWSEDELKELQDKIGGLDIKNLKLYTEDNIDTLPISELGKPILYTTGEIDFVLYPIVKYSDTDFMYAGLKNDGEPSVDSTLFIINIYTTESGIETSESTPFKIGEISFVQNTHSLNELDEMLKDIVEDAIADNGQNGVACTQAQWNAIKVLLDKSLYLNYEGTSLMKTAMGLNTYHFGFGSHAPDSCFAGIESVAIVYSEEDSLLFATASEV